MSSRIDYNRTRVVAVVVAGDLEFHTLPWGDRSHTRITDAAVVVTGPPLEPVGVSSQPREDEWLRALASRLRQMRLRLGSPDSLPVRADRARARLDEIIAVVEQGLVPGETPLHRASLGLQLEAVERLFESSGDPKSARVIGSIRDTLESDPDQTTGGDSPTPRRFEPPPVVAGSESRIAEPPPRSESTRSWTLRYSPVAVGLALGCLLLGILLWTQVSANRSVTDERGQDMPSVDRVDEGLQSPNGSVPADEPRVGLRDEVEAYEERVGELKSEVWAARSAVSRGEISEALRHTAAAVAIDRHHRLVRDLADEMIDVLVATADDAATHGRWTEAPTRLREARVLAESLFLDVERVEAGESRLASMRRFDYLTPDDHAGIRSAVGHPVRVTLAAASALDGRLVAFHDDVLTLEVDSGVSGGEVAFTTQVPLANVLEIRVFADSSR